MSELTNIVEELRQIHYQENAWHGPSLRKVLSGVNASQALALPLPDYRTIWELVLHISKWEEVFCLRLKGHAMTEPDEGDWPPVGSDTSESAWQNALQFLDKAHDGLIEIISELKDSDLLRTVAGKDYNVAFMLHGIVRHHVYHAGQIARLKRLRVN
jgi:uncharacterized damage-inducible protein DinB